MSEISPDATDARRIAEVERDRVRFEEDALALADQVYRVARRMVNSREEAEDLVQDTYHVRSVPGSSTKQAPSPGLAAAHPHEPQHRSWTEGAALARFAAA
ncbi:MAG: hypothetical protein F2663_01505 [Actinobacteria bacterium]|nr:hypothetical protein [Actinomycetota bacterium]